MLLPPNWIEHDLAHIACLAPLQEVRLQRLEQSGVRLLVKREDLLHPVIGGNKIYKLYYHLKHVLSFSQPKPIATFGGAFSNHILALAVAGQMLGIETVGIIRGERPEQLSPTLYDAEQAGMRLVFVSRSDYRRRDAEEFSQFLAKNYGEDLADCYWIAEGGASDEAVRACRDLAGGIVALCDELPRAVFHACGTGTSVAGLSVGFGEHATNYEKTDALHGYSGGSCDLCGGIEQYSVDKVYTYGVSVLKGHDQMPHDVEQLICRAGTQNVACEILQDYHFGGYAKFPEKLASFMQWFEGETRIPLDPVYTAKAAWAAIDLIDQGVFTKGDTIVLVHSGGLQGRRGFGLTFNMESVF